MRFLGIGDYNSLGAMYWRLGQEGHEVRVYIHEPEAHGIYAGMLQRTPDWRPELDWIRAAGADGIVIVETSNRGELADQLRSDGFLVVGGGAWTDRLENDRAYGQECMRSVGMRTAPVHRFADYRAAVAFVRDAPARYVYKLSDGIAASTRNYVGQMADGADVIALLEIEDLRRDRAIAPDFVLMQHVAGIEVGIGAYFNGRDFLSPACIDWEHKRFFPGDIGELTGEMGTVVSYRQSGPMFERTLGLLTAALRDARYCGYININTIVNEDGVWPLEFTCRFGYPGFAVCTALHSEGWSSVLAKMATGSNAEIATQPGFSVGVVLTVPPFPYEYGYTELSKGTPIFVAGDASAEDHRSFHYGEVERSAGQLKTSGSVGYVMVVTGVGADVRCAQQAAYRRVGKVVVPNMRYRNDIGDKLLAGDLERMTALGLLG